MTAPCRLCRMTLPGQPLLQLTNMPASAQGFPDKASLVQDKGADLRILQCEACGLVQADCAPVSYWREVIRATAFSPQMRIFRQAFLNDFVQAHQLAGKSVLEIGCGRGEYLSLLSEAGMMPVGTEFGVANSAAARAAGHTVIETFPDNPSVTLDGAPFSAFASFNFMEHWPDPSQVLRAIVHNMSDDCVGLIEVPNFDMILAKHLFSEFIADHLSYFTADSLKLVLNMNGFEVVSCQSIWHDYILSAIVRKRHPAKVEPFAAHRAHLQTSVDSFLKSCAGQGVALWGAGHQALATVSLLGLQDKIAYVVDSAPFKQGRYTPASHLPIHAPDHLRSEPVGSVLVMAAGFSDEIADILQRDFDPGLKIAILRDHGVEVVR